MDDKPLVVASERDPVQPFTNLTPERGPVGFVVLAIESKTLFSHVGPISTLPLWTR